VIEKYGADRDLESNATSDGRRKTGGRRRRYHFRFDETRQARVTRSPHRYIWPAEMDLMARLAGFELESRHADWTGAPFTAESTSQVSTYRRP
jgi:hypothetical protein